MALENNEQSKKEQSIKKNISFMPRMIDLVGEIQLYKGYPSFAAVIHHAITELHAKTFPAYRQSLNKSPTTKKDKKQRMQEDQEAREEMEADKQREIASQLGGKLVKNKTGAEICKYYNYSGKSRFLQEVPLNLLSMDLVATQYQPSKEIVEKYQREGKTDYADDSKKPE